MTRTLLAAAAFAAAAVPVAVAQQPTTPPGYVVVKVNTAVLAGGGAPDAAPPAADPEQPRLLTAVVPFKTTKDRLLYPTKRPHDTANPMGFRQFVSEYGTPFLYDDGRFIRFEYARTPDGKQVPPLDAAFRKGEKYLQWNRSRSPQAGYDAAAEALGLGLIDEAVKLADEVVKAADGRKDLTPDTPVGKFLALYKPLAARLRDPAPDNPAAERWKSLLRADDVVPSAHYAVVTWGEQTLLPRDAVDRRVKALELNFRGFYLWFAVNGIDIPFPERKLVVVLAPPTAANRDQLDVRRLRTGIDGLPIGCDGSYSPSQDVLVLSTERLDETGRTFGRLVRQQYQSGWDRTQLLAGTGPPDLPETEPATRVFQAMMLALADRAVEDEATWAAVTREATRQLFAASRLLPRNVYLPEWVEAGVGTLFQKPKGPVVTARPNLPPTAWVALAGGPGTSNYYLAKLYQDAAALKEFNPNPEELLANLLTDRYFEAVRTGTDVDPKPVHPLFAPIVGGDPNPVPAPADEKKAKAKLDAKAQVTAWALTHYLARKKPAVLMAFFAELNRLPRDTRLDRSAGLAAFCKAAKLDGPDGEVNKPEFKKFAEDWVKDMPLLLSGYDRHLMKLNLEPADPGPGSGVPTGAGVP